MANHDYISTTDGKAVVPDLCTEMVALFHGEPEPCLIEQPCPAHNPMGETSASVGALLSETLSQKHELEVRIASALAFIDSVPGDADYGYHWSTLRGLLKGKTLATDTEGGA